MGSLTMVRKRRRKVERGRAGSRGARARLPPTPAEHRHGTWPCFSRICHRNRKLPIGDATSPKYCTARNCGQAVRVVALNGVMSLPGRNRKMGAGYAYS